MIDTRTKLLAVTAIALGIVSTPAVAQTEPATEDEGPARATVSFLDLTAGGGYSSNPVLRTSDAQSSVFGRASARGVHAWNTELSHTAINGFVEASTYFNDYGLKSIFSVDGNTSHQVSERVNVFASAGVSGDIAGQLSNRFLYVPPTPDVPPPTQPPPVTVEDPDVFSFVGRHYNFYGQAGASVRMSPNSSLTFSGGARRTTNTNDFIDDYRTYFGNVSYDRTLSERTTLSAGVSGSYSEYDGTDDHSSIITPGLTIHTRLSEYWDATGTVGVTFSDVDRGAFDHSSTDFSFRGTMCHNSETERLCGRIARYVQSSSSASVVTTNSVGVDWYKALDPNQTLQLSASLVRYDEDTLLENNLETHHLRLAGSYSRRINNRLSAGADVGVRGLRRDGPDPDTDYSGSFFLRYRLGDLG